MKIKKITLFLLGLFLFICSCNDDHLKRKSDSIKYYEMVEYFDTDTEKCNRFRDRYFFKIQFKDTTGLELKRLADYLLKEGKQYKIDKNCDYPFYKDIFIYKSLDALKEDEGNWLIMNSPTSGFIFMEYQNK